MNVETERLKMKRATIRIITRRPGDDKACEHDIDGTIDPSGCFGIHPSRCAYDPLARWGVTHVPTKHKVGQFGTRAQCRAYIVALQALTDVDWTQTDVSYYRTPNISARTREIYMNA